MRFLSGVFAVLVGAGLLLAQAPPPLASQLVVSGLSSPVAFVQDPSQSNVQFVVEKGGRIRVVRDGVLESTAFLDIVTKVESGGEQGLLGLAFAPDYATSRRFFVNYVKKVPSTPGQGNTVIARFLRHPTNPLVADATSEFDLVWPDGQPFITQPFTNHKGGNLAFGPDGKLYIGLGDGGSGSDPGHRAQNPMTLLGKMLRIDVAVPDTDPQGYDVPPDNPFVGQSGVLPEIWAFGLRNPWRWAFDPPALGGTGAMVIADVGQSMWEEVNYEPAGRGGRNYGWRNREGAHDHVTSLPPFFTPLTEPIHEYSHSVGQSITGGFVYRGTALGAGYQGRYFFADFVSGKVWSLGLTIDGLTGEATAAGVIEHTAQVGTAASQVASFGIDGNGELYTVKLNGSIYRIRLAGNQLPSVSLTSPSNGATYPASSSVHFAATASDSDGSVTSVAFMANDALLHTDTTAPYEFDWPGVATGSYTLTAIATDNSGGSTTSAPVMITVNPATSGINVALAANGGMATASSTYPSSGFATAGAINGDRKGQNWGAGGGWNDATPDAFPDWLDVSFSAPASITEVSIFSVQDAYTSPVEPTPAQTFSLYGLQDFEVQYWTGLAWQTVPGGSVTGNSLVWRRISFAAVTTSRVRVTVTRALDTWSRVAEIEVWGTPGAARANFALASRGGTANASSTHSIGYAPAGTINGDRRGQPWGGGAGWNDATPDAFPDSLEVQFGTARTIDEINVFSVQDNYTAPADPTPTMTFTLYGLQTFDVQYWTGTAWATVPGGAVTGNSLVWRQLTFAPLSTTAIRVTVHQALNQWSRITELEAWGPGTGTPPPGEVNVALASQGATALASSVHSSGYGVAGAINGDRRGTPWGGNAGWNDATASAFPDWLEIRFAGSQTIDEIDVFSVQDNFTGPAEPTPTMTFTLYGLRDFQVEYWTGSAWAPIPGASVTGNTLVWRQFTFSPITTSRIRVFITQAADQWSRITEVEAWTSGGAPTDDTMVSARLRTPASSALAAPLVGRGPIDRRHLRVVEAQVHRQLPAVMHPVVEHAMPQHEVPRPF
jgi:glucose/arabinose dehydrogenase